VLADTSAWIEVRKSTTPQLAKQMLARALQDGQLRFSAVVRLEMYKGARNVAEVRAIDDRLRIAKPLPLAPAIADLAADAMAELAGDGTRRHHQIPIADALIAATAAAHRIHVLTCDWTDFPKLLEVSFLRHVELVHPITAAVFAAPNPFEDDDEDGNGTPSAHWH
jgi:predicted nucleic acid-binding protein